MSSEVITLRDGEDLAIIGLRGATCRSWSVGGVELLDGYRSQEEVDARAGYRGAVLAPWSNRIRDSRYAFAGATYDLGPDEKGMREGLHGLITEVPFTLADSAADHACLVARVPAGEAYPFVVDVRVTYRVDAARHALDLTVDATNAGTLEAPVTLGWHPYLLHHGGHEGTRLTLPARTIVRTDRANIPLPGADGFVAAGSAQAAEILPDGVDIAVDRDAVTITGPERLDHAFTDLVADADGTVRGLASFGDGSSVTVEMRGATIARGLGILQVYTGEGLDARVGEAVAFEPCLAMTDAFNRDECSDFVRLAPGQTRTLDASLVYQPAVHEGQ